MRAIERGLESLGLLSDSVRESLRRRLREVGGLALILLAGAVALALATWSVKDPSLSHATNAPIRNMLGMPGAVVADLLMQTLGVAAIALVLPIAIWGWRLITHRTAQPRAVAPAVLDRGSDARGRLRGRAATWPELAACRPGSAAWSAMRSSGCRPGSPAVR